MKNFLTKELYALESKIFLMFNYKGRLEIIF
jgi:hypothetical protein